ncbi:serine/threonine-protein kinase grp-like [Oratosquilla oratoria]|uniref:serine/threonine-protein kinase grp-like n=1 Tax=Oratosquilla oratoria TaxID=337810 RepID=UPI003F7664DE
MLRANRKQARAFKTHDWTTTGVLGAGSFGKVVLLKNKAKSVNIAKKVVTLKTTKGLYVGEEVVHFQVEDPRVINLFCLEREENRSGYTVRQELLLFMEYCSGGDLHSAINKSLRKEDALGYFDQLMSGVEHLHARGVAHRDLKPVNLLLTEGKVLKVADFGLANLFVVKGEEVRLQVTVGTPAYMAPEVFSGSTYLGPPVDLWSCGIILVNLLTRGWPWGQAVPEDDCYRMWVEKDPKLIELTAWNELDSFSRSVVDHHCARSPEEK